MEREQLLAALETEIRRHDFDCFVTEPLSIAQGGKGVVVPGCPACKKKIYTMAQFTDHLVESIWKAGGWAEQDMTVGIRYNAAP
jgi:hypothetical protein